MCGIAGIEIRGVATGTCIDNIQPSISRMTACLKHRCPDRIATWISGPIALGHSRLSIIDLTDTGNQPMHSADGRYVIVFNGEVYNYLELRKELEHIGPI